MAASFLDSIPGESRQALRKARALLMQIEADKKAGSNAIRSPFAKDTYSVDEFDLLAGSYEVLSWRMISRAGGATVKPEDFYRLYALAQQAQNGDCSTERPTWAERGGIDFDGIAKWEGWRAVAGLEVDKAKVRFSRLFHEMDGTANFYKDTRGDILKVDK
jgi:acyl-CoA-binding protein